MSKDRNQQQGNQGNPQQQQAGGRQQNQQGQHTPPQQQAGGRQDSEDARSRGENLAGRQDVSGSDMDLDDEENS